MDSAERVFLDYSARKLRQLTGRIEDCVGRLTDEQVWARGGGNENAIGNLVLHLTGNVRQWIVAGVGGCEDSRQRDTEFAARGGQPLPGLRGVVDAAAALLEALALARLAERIIVQGYDVTVLETIYSVVEHFAGHTGQIIYATKLVTGQDLGYYRYLKGAEVHAKQTP